MHDTFYTNIRLVNGKYIIVRMHIAHECDDKFLSTVAIQNMLNLFCFCLSLVLARRKTW